MAARRELREKFEILGHLGSGGMAEVFLARQESLERLVAIKELKPAFAQNPELYERFLREARTGAGLIHEHIIPVYLFGEGERAPFIVLEYLEGLDLKTAISRSGGIPPRIALLIFHAVAKALAYAHQRGLIHRDVKPGNIMLGKNGEVKLMDFGIARLTDSDLTRTGAFLGTPSYMAPEQFQGEKLTQAADQFSLGIVFYEALTGVKPFHADDETSLSKKIQTQREVPPRRLNPGIPRRIQRLVKRLLAKNPAKRFGETQELVTALEKMMTDLERTRAAEIMAGFLASSGVLEARERTTVVVGEQAREPKGSAVTPISIRPGLAEKSGAASVRGRKPADKSKAEPAPSQAASGSGRAEPARAEADLELPASGSFRWLWRLILVLILLLSFAITLMLSADDGKMIPEQIRTLLHLTPKEKPPPPIP